MFLKSSFQADAFPAVSTRQMAAAPMFEELLLFEEILMKGADLRVKVTGKSMAPFLNHGKVVRIRKVSGESLIPGDLIFFKTAYGAPVLHRIMAKKRLPENRIRYVTKGDALYKYDVPVMDDRILGKVVLIEKSGRHRKPKSIDLETGFWKRINRATALVQRVISKFRRCFPIDAATMN